MKAIANVTPPVVEVGVETDLQTDINSNLRVAPILVPAGATEESFTTGATDITDTASHVVFAAKGAGTHHYITSITVTNSSTGTDTVVYIEDGSTPIFSANAKAGSGFVFNPAPYLLQPTSNAGINIVCRTSSATIQANIIGFWV